MTLLKLPESVGEFPRRVRLIMSRLDTVHCYREKDPMSSLQVQGSMRVNIDFCMVVLGHLHRDRRGNTATIAMEHLEYLTQVASRVRPLSGLHLPC